MLGVLYSAYFDFSFRLQAIRFGTWVFFDSSDFLMILDVFGCTQECEPYDLDDDTVVGAADLQLFLASYGILCGE